jgi:hypothetical protein
MNKSTTALLANITDMQSRLFEMQQQLASQLHREQNGQRSDSYRENALKRGRVPYSYDRNAPRQSTHVANTSIRLQHAHSVGESSRPQRVQHDSDLPLPRNSRQQYQQQHQQQQRPYRERAARAPRASRAPRVASSEEKQEVRYETVTLSQVLQNDEDVTFRVIVKKDEQGNPVYTTTTAKFDGSVLNVVASELVPQLVGVQSAKPGEILYEFIDALKEAGHLKRSFTIAPWKLCTVVRDGQTLTLEELRRTYLASKDSAQSEEVPQDQESSQ